jgi:asparagine synthase (glutamine-hydrolysing)
MRLLLGLISKKNRDPSMKLKKIFSSPIKDHNMLLLNGNGYRKLDSMNELINADLNNLSNVCIWYPKRDKDSEKRFFKIFDKENPLYDYMIMYGSIWNSQINLDSNVPFNITNGNYVVITKKGLTFKISRDKIGIKQFYYGENPDFIAFSSRKTPLKLLGFKINKLTPGETLELTNKNIKSIFSNTLKRPKINIIQQDKALRMYKQALINAVKKRVKYQKKVGVVLSGGVDSSMIAKILKDLNKNIICYCVAKSGSNDYVAAKELANEYNIPIKFICLNEKNIERSLPQIISIIEDWSQFQVEEAVPVYFSSQKAAEDDINIIMNGQGPDRLFAGYESYPQILYKAGEKKLNERLWKDLMLGYSEIFERENKITEFFDQELRLPYYDIDVINTAMSISPNLKTKKGDVVGKFIHRVTGESLHVPLFITWRDKEFAFNSSGIHELIRKLAKKNGYIDSLEYRLKTDIEPGMVIKRYIDPHQPSDNMIVNNSVQSYFEDIAINLGLVVPKFENN